MFSYSDDIKKSMRVTMLPTQNVKSQKEFNKNVEFFGEPNYPIEFNFELAREIQIDIRSNIHLEPMYTYQPSPKWPYATRCEVYRFYLALRTYIEFPNSLIPLSELLDGILEGEQYITWLKKARSYVMVNSGSGFFLEDATPEDIKTWAKHKRMSDLGDMFNPRYWLFWSQTDEQDWRHFWIDYKPIEERHLEELYQVVLSLLPEQIESIAEEEILLDLSGSNGLDSHSLRTKKNWLLKETDNHFTDQPLLGKGSYIQKCPGDTRYSITLSVPHSNTVKLIEKQASLIAAELPWSCYVKNPEEYLARYTQFAESNSHFLCRDLTKDGITKVRPLIREVCRAIRTKYPDLPACKYFGIYDGFSYIGPNPQDPEGETLNFPPRGVGLGMSSALTTILQVALFKITKDRLYDRIDNIETIDALFYHDDAAVGSESLEMLEEYNLVEDEVMSDYRQLKKRTKSFYAEWFVLCERYSNSYDEKMSYQATILRQAHASANIAHAKAQWALNLQYCSTVDWEKYLDEICDHFGYEFYPEETRYPLTHGGWVPAQYLGVDISWAYTKDHTQASMAASIACKLYPLYSKRNKKKYQGSYCSPFMKLYPNLSFGDQGKAYVAHMDKWQVADMYTKFDRPGTKLGYWDHQLRNRSYHYNLYRRHKRDIKQYFALYLEEHPTVDVIPPDDLLVTQDEAYIEVERPWKPPNPRLSYLAYLNPGKLPSSIIPYPVPPGISVDGNLQLSSEQRRQLAYSLQLLQHNNIGEPPVVNVGLRYYLHNDTYYNPTAVANYMIATRGLDRLPVIPPRENLKGVREKWYPLAHILYGQNGPLYEYLMSRNISTAKYHLNATTYLDAVLDALANRTHMIDKIKAYMHVIEDEDLTSRSAPPSYNDSNIDPNFVWTNAELSDSGYWFWTYSKRNYRNWRQKYFESIEDKVLAFETKFMGKMVDHHIVEDPDFSKNAFDSVEVHLWKCSGGEIFEKDGYFLPVVRGSLLDREEPGYESPDIFKSSSSQEGSGENLMAGW